LTIQEPVEVLGRLLSSTNGGLFFLKVKQMINPSVDKIFLRTVYYLNQELARFCLDLAYLYVPKFTLFSFKAGFSLHSDFHYVKILLNNLAQFVLGSWRPLNRLALLKIGVKVGW
jgi:hypothetical protein